MPELVSLHPHFNSSFVDFESQLSFTSLDSLVLLPSIVSSIHQNYAGRVEKSWIGD